VPADDVIVKRVGKRRFIIQKPFDKRLVQSKTANRRSIKMKKMGFIVGLVMVSMLVAAATEVNAQLRSGRHSHSRIGSRHAAKLAQGGNSNRVPVYTGTDAEGMTLNGYEGRVNIFRTLKMASHNPYSPQPVYTYSNRGLDAGRSHTANQNEAAGQPWHGNYMNWRWREPTALVVPPTSVYQTTYKWGVGQTRSTPIRHQFGRQNAGMTGGGAGNYSPTPYWPSSTEQFGIYPVRAPW
jgi:hypothetical protein